MIGIIMDLFCLILFKIIEYILVNLLLVFYMKFVVGVRVEEVFIFLYIIVLKRWFNWLYLVFVSLKRGLNEMFINFIFFMLYVYLLIWNICLNYWIIWKLKLVNNKWEKNIYMWIYKFILIDNFF